MSFFENTRKPEGLGGKIMVAAMNVGHSATGSWPNEIVAIGVRHKVVLDAYAAALREAFPDRRPDSGTIRRAASRWEGWRSPRWIRRS